LQEELENKNALAETKTHQSIETKKPLFTQ